MRCCNWNNQVFLVKKKELADKYPPMRGVGSQLLSREYRHYVEQMGVEASIIHLSQVAGHSCDEILLFTYETFILEVTKYDFKALAEQKEQEAIQKQAEIKAKLNNG